jgi:hypothetical protein
MLMLASWMRSLQIGLVTFKVFLFIFVGNVVSMAAISTPQGRNKTLSATCSLNRILNKIVYLLFKRYYSSAESSPLFIKKETQFFWLSVFQLVGLASLEFNSQYKINRKR